MLELKLIQVSKRAPGDKYMCQGNANVMPHAIIN